MIFRLNHILKLMTGVSLLLISLSPYGYCQESKDDKKEPRDVLMDRILTRDTSDLSKEW
jgi:hypothetical protein